MKSTCCNGCGIYSDGRACIDGLECYGTSRNLTKIGTRSARHMRPTDHYRDPNCCVDCRGRLAAMIEKVSTLRAIEKEVLKLTRGHCLCGLSIVRSCGNLDDFNRYNAIYMLRINW